MPRRAVLQEIPVGACPHYFADDVVIHRPGKDNYLDTQKLSAYAPDQFDPVQIRKIQIHHSYVRPPNADLIERGLAVRTTGHYFDFRVRVEDRRDSVAAQRISIGQEDRYFW